ERRRLHVRPARVRIELAGRDDVAARAGGKRVADVARAAGDLRAFEERRLAAQRGPVRDSEFGRRSEAALVDDLTARILERVRGALDREHERLELVELAARRGVEHRTAEQSRERAVEVDELLALAAPVERSV